MHHKSLVRLYVVVYYEKYWTIFLRHVVDIKIGLVDIVVIV